MKKTTQTANDQQPLNHEQEKIRAWLRQVRFRKTIVGGVSEADVWKKIGELNELYESALAAERARYDALLKERVNMVARQLAKRMQQDVRQERGADETEF